MQLFLFLFPLQHIKRPALQNKQAGVLRMAFRARKAFGTFGKRAPGLQRSKRAPRNLTLFSRYLKFFRGNVSLYYSSVFLPLSLRLEELSKLSIESRAADK